MRVKLIVTGKLEKAALHRSLGRWFPRTGGGEPVEFMPPSMFQGPTCNRLDGGERLSELVRTFTTALVAETLFGSERGARPPDLVVGVDDLELENMHQPEVVAGCIRLGVEDYFIRNGGPAEHRHRATLRSKCSFHLLVPMAETYFFGERAALERAGVAADVHAQLCCEDLEAFETDDPQFASDPRHPKRYLAELLRRSGRPVVRPYRETHDGARAMESLAWPELSENPETLAFARALFEDLADALDIPNPLGDGALAPATHPRDRRDLVLRNL
jgi:hypothetical protein